MLLRLHQEEDTWKRTHMAWHTHMASHGLVARTEGALRRRLGALRRTGLVPAPLPSTGSSSSDEGQCDASMVDAAVSLLRLHADSAWRMAVAARHGRATTFQRTALVYGVRKKERLGWVGRSWTYALRGAGGAVRPGHDPDGELLLESHRPLLLALMPGLVGVPVSATATVAINFDKVRVWLLRRARRVLQCRAVSRERALGMAARLAATETEAEKAGLITRGGTPLPTILEAGFRNTWLGGRYVDGADLARWFGLTRKVHGKPWWQPPADACKLLRRALLPRHVWGAVAVSMELPFARAVVRKALCLLPEHCHPVTWRYASMYSGGLDAFAHALAAEQVSFTYEAAAECSPVRRRLLCHVWPVQKTYRSAGAMARAASTPLDILGWTPPCPPVSQGAVMGARTGVSLERAMGHMRRVLLRLAQTLQATAPLLVIGEEVAGLRTHWKAAWEMVCEDLPTLPYRWLWAEEDAADMHAPSHRTRIAFIAIRYDLAT